MKFLLFSVIFIGGIAQAQDLISTDRPDQSEGVFVLPRKQLQLETGITFSKNNLANNTMLRYGITKTTELRLESDVETWDTFTANAITLSAKQKIYESDNFLPSITGVGYLSYTPDVNNPFSVDAVLAFENVISSKFSIEWNIGSQNGFQKLVWTTNAGYSPNERLTLFAEYYGYFGNSLPDHNVDFGVMYIINPNFQIDFAVGQSIFTTAGEPFATAGISYRFKNNQIRSSEKN